MFPGRIIPGFAMTREVIVVQTIHNGARETCCTNEKQLFVRFGVTFSEKASVVGNAFVDVIFGRHNFKFGHCRKASLVPFRDVDFDVFDHQLLVTHKLSKGAIGSLSRFLGSRCRS